MVCIYTEGEVLLSHDILFALIIVSDLKIGKSIQQLLQLLCCKVPSPVTQTGTCYIIGTTVISLQVSYNNTEMFRMSCMATPNSTMVGTKHLSF